MKITLCDKNLKGDIPTHYLESIDEAKDLIHHWLNNKDYDKSVFVCFQTWGNLPNEQLRNEQSSILVAHSWDDITDLVETYLDSISIDEIDFSIFEFEDYQEAFLYCKDLKESF